ncbi:MAG: hypothetical protein K6F09_00480 [Clostridiales bacterium]|nr:hypothetical protein [Clostridiales bacterium]
MKKILVWLLTAALTISLVFSALSPLSFAESAKNIETGESDVTLSVDNDSETFYFTPSESAYYRFCAEDADNFFITLEVIEDDGTCLFSQDSVVVKHLTANAKYTLVVSTDFYGMSDDSVSFKLDIEKLGEIKRLRLEKAPDKLVYMDGFDFSENDPDIYINLKGAVINVTFDGGTTLTLRDKTESEYVTEFIDYSLFTASLGGSYATGRNTVVLTFDEDHTLSFDIFVIENPIESVEITKMPDKSEYTYGIDGDFQCEYYGTDNYGLYFIYDVDYSGLEVTINYKDEAKQADVAVYDPAQGIFLIDGKPASYYSSEYDTTWEMGNLYGFIFVGTDNEGDYNQSSFTVDFLSNEAEGNFTLKKTKGFKKIKAFFRLLKAFRQAFRAYIKNSLRSR